MRSLATLLRERMPSPSALRWLETSWQDVRFGFRQLRKAPVFLSVSILSLGLGIGANTAIFTLINAIMLQSLPVHDPGRLVLFNDDISTGIYSGDSFPGDIFSYPWWQYLQSHKDSFQDVCAFRQGQDRVVLHVAGETENGPQEQASVHLVSGNYFSVLGVGASAGRILTPSDDSRGAPRVAVLSYAFWQERFHGERTIFGKQVILNGVAFTVAGAAAREFFGERIQTPPDFWVPLVFQPEIVEYEAWNSKREASWLTARNVYWLNLLGRLKPGVTIAAAQASVTVRLRQFYREQAGGNLSPERERMIQAARIALKPGGGGISGLRFLYSKPLHVLMGVVALVLLIACANIATLLSARAAARRPEFLARLALGASRGRLIRQVLTESTLLSLIGGLGGVLLAWWCVRMLVLLLSVSPVVTVKPDPLVMTFTLVLSVLTGLLFGITPAVRFSRMEARPGNIAKPAALRALRLGNAHALISFQVALSLCLLVAAGLLAHSLFVLETQNAGFNRAHLLLVGTDAGLAGYRAGELNALYREIGDQANALPHVTSAALVRFAPESGSISRNTLSIEGVTPARGKQMNVDDIPAGARFFETLGIPILHGRGIGPRDTAAAPPVAVVNQTFVDAYLPDQNPIGRHIMLGTPFAAPGVEIVGVVADSRYIDLRDKAVPTAFFPIGQRPVTGFEIVLRTPGAPERLSGAVRTMLKGVNGRLPVLHVTTLDHQIKGSLREQRMITSLSSIFGLVALALCSIGIYGTLAYSVAGRTAEIGIRMAIGAQRTAVVWMILRDSLILIAVGLLLGLPLALGATHWIKSFLFGVPALDPVALALAFLLIVAIALAAGCLPAYRAAQIQPMRALRHD